MRKFFQHVLVLTVAMTSQFVFAEELNRRNSNISRNLKASAPTKEDHAAYFSENRRNLSPEELQKVDQIRVKTINSIDQLVSQTKGARRFELLLRKGELLVERHDYMRDREIEEYTEEYDQWEQNGKKGPGPKINHSGSKGELTKAANSFRQLVNEFPKHPRTDAALYALAKTLSRLDNDNSVAYYNQLIRTFPKSPLIPDAYLALGEYYFDKHNIPEAMKNYKSAMNYKTSKTYPFAVYKLGWAFINASSTGDQQTRENLEKAVAAFKLVIKLSDKDKKGAKSQLNLRQEAINDLVTVWAEIGDIDSAWKYFKTIGEEEFFYKTLERLGHIYSEQGKSEQAIEVYQRLLREAPARKGNAEIQIKLVSLNDTLSRYNVAVNELRTLAKVYIVSKNNVLSEWAKNNQKDVEAMKLTQQSIETTIHRYGTLFHQRGQKAKNDKVLLTNAAQIYELYLQYFDGKPTSSEIRFYLAEILSIFNQDEKAAGHYLTVSRAKFTDKKYIRPASLNAVAAMNKVVSDGKFEPVPAAGKIPQPLTIPAQKSKLVEAIDNFAGFFPKDKDLPPMLYTAASIFFDYGHYEPSIKRHEQIIQNFPDTKQAKTSAKIILGFYVEKQDFDKIISYSRSFSQNKALNDKDLDAYIAQILKTTMFKRALVLEKQKNHTEAAHAFLAFQKEFPKDSNGDRALYNASVNFYNASDVDSGMKAQIQLLNEYKTSTLRPDVSASVAQAYEDLGEFQSAIKYYISFAQEFPSDKRASSAIYNAAVLAKA